MNCIELKKENIGKGYLVLINPDNLLKQVMSNLVSFSDEYKKIKLEKKVSEQLELALNEIKSENKIVLVSGYRTLEEQTRIYETSLKENGEEFTRKFVALPNASEHQTGLAIDLALNEGNIDFIAPSFPYHSICQEFRKIASKYGFIERYKDLCLEEYIKYLKQFIYPNNPLKYEKYNIFYIPYKDESYIEINKNFSISGNNIDGFILTVKE